MRLSPPKYFNLFAIWTDIYIGVCWLVEVLIVFFYQFGSAWTGLWWIIVCVLLGWRLLDLFFVLTTTLIRGCYRYGGPWPLNRGVLLVILNAIEIFVIYGVLYYTLAREFAVAAKMGFIDGQGIFRNVFEAIYFSIVTGVTLGYGDIYPIGWLSRLLAMTESCFVLLVLVVVIAFFKDRAWGPEDSETTGQRIKSSVHDA